MERSLGSGSFVSLAYLPREGGGGSLLYEEKIGSPANIRESASENTSFQVSRAVDIIGCLSINENKNVIVSHLRSSLIQEGP